MTAVVTMQKMNRKQKEAYNQWLEIKRQIADLEKLKRPLEKQKSDLVKIFDGAFVDGSVVIGPNGKKVLKKLTDVHVDAYDYTKTEYKEG